MTEYELADLTNSTLSLVASYQDNYATHITIYLSLVFGFCALGYIAGRKLTNFSGPIGFIYVHCVLFNSNFLDSDLDKLVYQCIDNAGPNKSECNFS
jgi:hypothetical protein